MLGLRNVRGALYEILCCVGVTILLSGKVSALRVRGREALRLMEERV